MNDTVEIDLVVINKAFFHWLKVTGPKNLTNSMFFDWLKTQYGVGNNGGIYFIVDEQKYLLCLLKFS